MATAWTTQTKYRASGSILKYSGGNPKNPVPTVSAMGKNTARNEDIKPVMRPATRVMWARAEALRWPPIKTGASIEAACMSMEIKNISLKLNISAVFYGAYKIRYLTIWQPLFQGLLELLFGKQETDMRQQAQVLFYGLRYKKDDRMHGLSVERFELKRLYREEKVDQRLVAAEHQRHARMGYADAVADGGTHELFPAL